MHIIVNAILAVFLLVTILVLVSYTIRRYELGNMKGGAAERAESLPALRAALGIAGEIGAVLLSLALYPLGFVFGNPPPWRLRPGERTVILCHGYMHNSAAFLLMRYRLKRAGWENVVAPNFRPLAASVPYFADRLSKTVGLALSHTGCDKVDLVGHSMGGLVVRYFVERLDGSSSVRTAITLGAPNDGTRMAALAILESAEQFRPDSALIADLRKGPEPDATARVESIWSDFDSVVLPPENARLPESYRSTMVSGVGHVALLYSGRVFAELRSMLSEDPEG